jgi:1,2-phenylacetyl-CoA epoxidase catalytic subunit
MKRSGMTNTLRRLVLRFLARLAYDTYIRSESRLTQEKSFHRASTDDLVAALRRVKEARAIHERFQERLSQNTERHAPSGAR